MLEIENLPSRPWGFSSFSRYAPRLDWLTLESEGTLVLDGRLWPGRPDRCTFRARRIEAAPLPKKLRSVSLALSEATDDDVAALLGQVERLEDLSLRGTPVTDEFVEAAAERWKLRTLDVVDTQVGLDCIRRVRARYPHLRIRPELPS